MNSPLSPEQSQEIERLPPGLKKLVLDELADGNGIAQVGGPPAPPAGAAVRLSRPISEVRRRPGEGYSFYERNSSLWFGEFTDPQRLFFVLEPPRPPEPEPDMDAIRARVNFSPPTDREGYPIHRPGDPQPVLERDIARQVTRRRPNVERFLASQNLNYSQWKEGESYDLEALRRATPDERRELEVLLTGNKPSDWRDVEALAEFDTPAARAALRHAATSGAVEVRLAVLRFAPSVLTTRESTRVLVTALDEVVIFGGLTAALELVVKHHPKPVLDALWHGVLHRPGEVASHFAGMLLYLAGKAALPFDWNHRPFLLRFNATDPAERAAAARELCERLGDDPSKRLHPPRRQRSSR